MNDLFANNNLTAAAQVLLMNTRQMATAYVQITGTWSGTLVFEGTVDGINWFSVNAIDNTGAAPVTSTTANGQWSVNVAGLVEFRVRCSVFTSGTITVNIHANEGFVQTLLNGGTISGNLIVTGNLTVQGTTTSVVNQTTTGTVTIKKTSSTAFLIQTDAGAATVFTFDSASAATPNFTITGTTNPSITIQKTNATARTWLLQATGDIISINLSGSLATGIAIDNSGNVGIGNSTPVSGTKLDVNGSIMGADGGTTVTGIGFHSQRNTGMSRIVSNVLSLVANGTETVRVNAGGLQVLGIGTSTSGAYAINVVGASAGTPTTYLFDFSNTLDTNNPRVSFTYNSTSAKAFEIMGSIAGGAIASLLQIQIDTKAMTIPGALTITGAVTQTAKTTTYNNIATGGWGVPAIYSAGRATAQVAANASVATYTVGASDGSFIVSANVLVTTSSAEAFSVQCSYTDEGNTARTVTFNFTLVAGTFQTAVAFANGAVPYEGVPLHIRAKAGTAITIKTQAAGTYTGCTFNVEGLIAQIA